MLCRVVRETQRLSLQTEFKIPVRCFYSKTTEKILKSKIFSCVRQWGGRDRGLQIFGEGGPGIAAEGMDMADLLLAIAHRHAGEVEAMVVVVGEEEPRKYLF